jgi:hypothetical protein
MFFMVACVVGATVILVVIGAAVISVVIGTAVISVVTDGTGVGVTVAGFWAAHPANSAPAVTKTTKIRKILSLSMTEFSISLLLQEWFNLDRRIIKNFLRLFKIPRLTLVSCGAG